MSTKHILFDIPSRDPRHCWSLNPWKTRLLLNYKNISYETHWVEYPDIKPTLQDHVTPNETGWAYSSPTVIFPDGTYVQDSRQIANRIEKEVPNPSLHLNSPVLLKMESIILEITRAIYPEIVRKIPTRILNEASWPHWYKTREARFDGKPLDEVEKEMGGEPAYKNATPHLSTVTELLRAGEGGPFFDGNQVTYVDFVWAAFLRFTEEIGDDVHSAVLQATGDKNLHLKHLEACRPWLTRDSH